jgi:poly(A) polymerase
LKWAALLHDVGKPVKYEIDEARQGKITFYNHDLAGVESVESIAERFRWSSRRIKTVAQLVATHMRPFHLANVARRQQVSVKACIRLIKKLGGNLPGLFLVAMADARSGRGDSRPEAIEAELSALYQRIETVRTQNVSPVLKEGVLITGRDLIQVLKLQPGPVFKVILEKVETAQMENIIKNRAEALDLAKKVIAEQNRRAS